MCGKPLNRPKACPVVTTGLRFLPFTVKAPNATTRRAIADWEAGRCQSFATVEKLMADINADD